MRKSRQRPTAQQWLWAELERRFGAETKREIYDGFLAQSRAYQQLVWHPDTQRAIRYRCLICDVEMSFAAFQDHATTAHAWSMDVFRQCGFSCDQTTRIATHEFSVPGEPSAFWLLRSIAELPAEAEV